MRTVIIDDEKHGLETLKKMLELYCPEVELVGVARNAQKGKEIIESEHAECVLLDIAMPGKSGLELMHDLRHLNLRIIFVTAHNHYLLQALRLSAIDYLLKPVHEDDLIKAVQKAKQVVNHESMQTQLSNLVENTKMMQLQDMKICLPDFEGYHIRRVGNIIYCEADNTYTKIHLINQEVMVVSKSLLNYELLLRDFNFFRIHKSYLINMHHLLSFHKADGGYVVLSNQQRLDVAKRKKDTLSEEIRKLFKT